MYKSGDRSVKSYTETGIITLALEDTNYEPKSILLTYALANVSNLSKNDEKKRSNGYAIVLQLRKKIVYFKIVARQRSDSSTKWIPNQQVTGSFLTHCVDEYGRYGIVVVTRDK